MGQKTIFLVTCVKQEFMYTFLKISDISNDNVELLEAAVMVNGQIRRNVNAYIHIDRGTNNNMRDLLIDI